LDNAFGSGPAGKEEYVETLRSRAKEGLEDAAKDGRLSEAIRAVKPSGPQSKLSLHFEDEPVHATSMIHARSIDQDEPATAQKPPPEKTDIAALRSRAKERLSDAAKDGSLNEAVSDIKASNSHLIGSKGKDIKSLKARAKEGLDKATKDGSLEKAVAGPQAPAPDSAASKGQPPAKKDISALRSRAKEGLQNANKDGRLEHALSGPQSAPDSQAAAAAGQQQPPKKDISELRSRAKEGLTGASRDGSLEQLLSSPESGPDASGEGQRQQQQTSVGQGRRNEPRTEPQVLGVDELRKITKTALSEACRDGRLRQSFESRLGPQPAAVSTNRASYSLLANQDLI